MKCFTLYQERDHRWLLFGQDIDKPDNLIDSNQIAVISGSKAILFDPGGMELFPSMVAALSHELPLECIDHLFLSHQDPDISSALPLWRQVCKADLQIHTPGIWTGFLGHFDHDARLHSIPDEGMDLTLSHDVKLQMLPAHYLHSSGNFSVYDPTAKILFTGDIGGALVPKEKIGSIFVSDFKEHANYMDYFHRRWMGSARARDLWIEMVSKLDVDMLVPQHGLVMKGDDVKRFLDWFAALPVGSALDAYRKRIG